MATIPSPPSYPLIKNLPSIDVNSPLQSIVKLAQQYGEIYQLVVPGLDTVVISSPRLVEQITDEKKITKLVHGPLPFLKDFVGDGLFTADSNSEAWERAHLVLRSSFSAKQIQYYHNSMLDIVDQMLTRWQHFGPNYQVDVSTDMTKVTLDIVALCCFGYRFNNFYRMDSHPFLDSLNFCLKEANERPKRLPGTSGFFFKRNQRFKKMTKNMHALVNRVIFDRKQSLSRQAQQTQDLLDHMLDRSCDGPHLNDTEILDQIMTFLIAGHETTSGLLAFAFYEILNNPSVLGKIKEEISQTFGNDMTARPTYEQIKNMKYLDTVVNETLRLWPTLPVYGVQSEEEIVFSEGWSVKPQQELIVLLPQLHKDPEFWGANADQFDPDRFQSLTPKDYKHAFQPWGRGRRSCLGRFFAIHEIKMILAMSFLRFEIDTQYNKGHLNLIETLSFKPDNFHMSVHCKSLQN